MSTVHYDRFYAEGGWPYEIAYEKALIKDLVIVPLQLSPPASILEVGCGVGLHASLLRDEGFEVTAIDASSVAIDVARKQFPGPTYHHLDAANIACLPQDYDILLVRGMCWYHYELSGVNKEGVDIIQATELLLSRLKEQGLFVLLISTDFSGLNSNCGVRNNMLNEYTNLLSRFGEIVLLTNWDGIPLESQKQARHIGGNIAVAIKQYC